MDDQEPAGALWQPPCSSGALAVNFHCAAGTTSGRWMVRAKRLAGTDGSGAMATAAPEPAAQMPRPPVPAKLRQARGLLQPSAVTGLQSAEQIEGPLAADAHTRSSLQGSKAEQG